MLKDIQENGTVYCLWVFKATQWVIMGGTTYCMCIHLHTDEKLSLAPIHTIYLPHTCTETTLIQQLKGQSDVPETTLVKFCIADSSVG